MTLNLRNTLFIGAALAMLVAFALPIVTQAQGFVLPENDANLVPVENDSINGLVDVITRVTQFLAGLLAVLAVLAIVISGILYITSGGDEGRIATAKSWLTFAIIGLIIALLAYVIVATVAGALIG